VNAGRVTSPRITSELWVKQMPLSALEMIIDLVEPLTGTAWGSYGPTWCMSSVSKNKVVSFWEYHQLL